MKDKVKVVRGANIVSVQVWTEGLKGRPFPAWAVLVDFKDDGTFSGNPNKPELVALREEILSQI